MNGLDALRSLRIGYAPLSEDYSYPGDRRRFCYYAQARGLKYERADPEEDYDVVVVSQGGDLSRWSRYSPDRGRVVFDFVDAYLSEQQMGIRPALRGIAKFAFRQTRHLHVNYRELLKDMCRRADAVVCTTSAQQEIIENLCRNAHVILDVQSRAVRDVKTSYDRGDVFNIVWEGLAGNIITFEPIAEALQRLQKEHQLAFHLITDLERPIGLRDVGHLSTKRLVRRVFEGVENVYLYEWNEELFSKIATSCDLAVVPIPLEKSIYAGKPENKLVLFWRMGLPVITSATPAYATAMRGAGLDMTCKNSTDWYYLLEYYLRNDDLRKFAGIRGKEYAESQYGEEALLRKWDMVMMSLLSSGDGAATETQTNGVAKTGRTQTA